MQCFVKNGQTRSKDASAINKTIIQYLEDTEEQELSGNGANIPDSGIRELSHGQDHFRSWQAGMEWPYHPGPAYIDTDIAFWNPIEVLLGSEFRHTQPLPTDASRFWDIKGLFHHTILPFLSPTFSLFITHNNLLHPFTILHNHWQCSKHLANHSSTFSLPLINSAHLRWLFQHVSKDRSYTWISPAHPQSHWENHIQRIQHR